VAELVAPAQRKRLLSTMFTELRMRDGELESATPHPDWLDYFEHVTRVPSKGLVGHLHALGTGVRLVLMDGRIVPARAA